MSKLNRRKFIAMTTGSGIATLWGPLLEKALAIQAHNITRSINDVKHIVILMQENRSFDHYFGALKGVRGFGDRFPIPLKGGQRVFYQSDGERVVPPYRANGKTSNAALVQGTPHNFSDMQAAWNQGKYGFWPLFKTPYSMAYYTREEIPFQYAMAESFTICDAHFCSVATGTDPNRIMFWSGANFNPERRAAGVNCTDQDSEPVNKRCWITGTLPEPGYTYQGNALKWPTIPDVLQEAGISWRIYQNPNDNWTGAMHGGLAFESFREAKPDSSIYKNGMQHWSLEDLKNDVLNDTLAEVSWILPSQKDSEHPGAPSSPYRAANFTHQILEAIISNPSVWSKTVFFVTFDENDGFFDHLPAPAVPSYNLDGTLAGKSTIDTAGMYFDNGNSGQNYLDKRDTVSGNLRPWGMGPRVPMYILSPWSKGGWVNSEVADHTSVGQFIEKRFGVTIPAISPWHRAVSSDLTSAFDFVTPNDPEFPRMPETSDYETRDEASGLLPKAMAPEAPSALFQEKGTRFSRALPYRLHCHMRILKKENKVKLFFENKGKAGAVYHVYDLHNLDAIPRRYTVEAGKSLDDEWALLTEGTYDLEVFGPNGYFQKFSGSIDENEPETTISYDHIKGGLSVVLRNTGNSPLRLMISSGAYHYTEKASLDIEPGESRTQSWDLADSGNWYDFSITSADKYLHRFAGRVETGKHSVSDPAMASEIGKFVKTTMTLLLTVLAFTSAISQTSAHKSSQRPNVIIIYSDDQGYADLNIYGSKDLATPNLDRLARSGTRFTQFYAAAPICSPSRASLLTGRYPQRAGLVGNASSQRGQAGMPGSQYTMAEMFKAAGYKTAHIGKWHVGYSTETMPNAQGFDYSFGFMGGCIDNYSHFFYWDGPNQHDLWRNGKEVYEPGKFFPDLMVAEAGRFMAGNRDTPFFMYFAINSPHYPLQPETKWLDYYKDLPMPRRMYAAYTSTMDEKVGDLLKRLDELGLAKNTIVVFQSDQGFSKEERTYGGGGSAMPYRGSKESLFEGGIRVPAFIRWPGHIPVNAIRSQFATNIDWYVTLAEYCHVPLPERKIDGRSLIPVIGSDTAQSPHPDFYWQCLGTKNNPQWAVREGDWKLLHNPLQSNPGDMDTDGFMLINMKEDSTETTNLAAQHPEMVQRLKQKYQDWIREAVDQK